MRKLEKLTPGTDEWSRVVDTDLPKTRVTAKSREVSLSNSRRYRGSVRVSMGRFMTDDEYETRRKNEMRKPLP